MLGLVITLLLSAATPAADSSSLWQQAQTFLDHQQYAEARRVLTLAVKEAPNEGAFWFYLGVSCSQLQDTESAIHAFERARMLSPKRSDVYFALGVEYWRWGDLGKAKEAYQSGLALDPKEPRALQNYALLLMKTGEYQKAITSLLLLKNVPALALGARVSLIECYLKIKDREAADRETNELLGAGVAGPEEETKLAKILFQEGDSDAAERVLRVSLRQQPDQAKACAALGAILMEKKDYGEAAQSLERAAQLEPDSLEYTMAFADSLLLWDKESVLIPFLKTVEPKFGQTPEYQYRLALAYYGANRFTDAAATLEKLLQMNPPREDQVYYVLGNSYLAARKLAEAEKAYRKAIEINPKEGEYYEALASLLRKDSPDRVDEAIAQLKHGIQFGASGAGVSFQLALCYESKGDVSDAVSLAQDAVRLRPQFVPGHIALSRIYFKLGRKADEEKERKIIAELEEKEQQERLPKPPPGSLERTEDQAVP